MSDHDFDRLIDNAARQLVWHRPSRQLKAAVMARIGGAEPAAPRRFMWATAAVAVALCAVIAIVVITRGGRVAQSVTVQAPASSPAHQMAAKATADVPAGETAAMPAAVRPPPERPQSVARSSIEQAPSHLPTPATVSAIEPLETEPIAMTVVDVPPLEDEIVSIEVLEIEPLTIEPLTAAND